MSKRRHTTYPDSFKTKMVELYTTGTNPSAISKIYNVPEQTVIGWVHKTYDVNSTTKPIPELQSESRLAQDIEQLKRVNARLKAILQILVE